MGGFLWITLQPSPARLVLEHGDALSDEGAVIPASRVIGFGALESRGDPTVTPESHSRRLASGETLRAGTASPGSSELPVHRGVQISHPLTFI